MTSFIHMGPEEIRFLEAVPWKIDGLLQPPDQMLRVLANEAQRFAGLPDPIVVTLVATLLTPTRVGSRS